MGVGSTPTKGERGLVPSRKLGGSAGVPSFFECPEHGRVRAIWKKDLRMRAGRHTACPYCNRLSFKAWEVVNREYNRSRVREWYWANRDKKIAYERGR